LDRVEDCTSLDGIGGGRALVPVVAAEAMKDAEDEKEDPVVVLATLSLFSWTSRLRGKNTSMEIVLVSGAEGRMKGEGN